MRIHHIIDGLKYETFYFRSWSWNKKERDVVIGYPLKRTYLKEKIDYDGKITYIVMLPMVRMGRKSFKFIRMEEQHKVAIYTDEYFVFEDYETARKFKKREEEKLKPLPFFLHDVIEHELIYFGSRGQLLFKESLGKLSIK